MNTGQNMRFSKEELATLRAAFKGNVELLKLLRKVFLPEIDPKAPLGQQVDLWMTINLEHLTPDAAMIRIQARNEVIMHIESSLMQLQLLSEMSEESDEATEVRRKKDSSK